MIVLVVWSALKFGVPFLARKAAFSMPPATEAALGRESLQVLDKLFLSPSRLQTARKVALVKRFRQMTGELPDGGRYRLEFRGGGKIGANAFALPSGIIVVTDRLVQIAKSEDEIVGVLAHEMGHVRYRHAVRHLLQNSGVLFLVAAVTGDVMSASSLSATLPTVLIDAKYSREFEEEADDAAVAYLKSHRIPVSSFARMLARLEAEHTQVKGKTGDKDRGGIADFFSTHPVTSERIDRIMRSR
jgi:Zn-dependent protease with chaperone function